MSSATTPIRLKVAADLGVTAGTIGLGNVENKTSAQIRAEIVAADLAGGGKAFSVLPASGATVGATIGVNFDGQFTAGNITNFFAAKVITAGIIDVTDLFAQAISVTDTVKVGSDTGRYLLTLDGRGTASPIAIIDKQNAGALVFGFDSDDKPYFGGGLRDGAIDSVNVFTDEVLTQLKPIVVGSTGGIFKVAGLPSMIGATLNKTVTVTPANPSSVLIGLSFSDYFLNIASSVNLNFTPPKYMVTIKRSLNGGTATTIHSQMYTGTALNQRDPEVNKWECSFAINVDIAISDINHAANNNDSITYTFTVTRSSGAYSAAKITAASCSQQTQGGGAAGVASQLTAPYVGLTANGHGSYPAMEVKNNPATYSDWIRTPATGLLPYTIGGASTLGTPDWQFNTIYGKAIYDNNNRVYSAVNPNIGTGASNYAAGNHGHAFGALTSVPETATRWPTAIEAGTAPIAGDSTAQNGYLNLIASNYALGFCLYPDIDFASGSNSVWFYNNSGGDGVTHTRQADASAPNFSKQVIKISHNPALAISPGFGGFVTNMPSAANKIFVQVFVAKLPVGRYFITAENSMGTNSKTYWATSNHGTGKWERYIRITMCGDSGGFSSGGHIYVVGGSATAFDTYLAECTVYDLTSVALPYNKHNKPSPADIGAQPAGSYAASGHTHSYLPLTGGTLTGELVMDQRIKMNPVYGSGSFGVVKHQASAGGESWLTAISDTLPNHNAIGISQNEGPKCWLNGAMYRIYHQGFKPTPAEIGAQPAGSYAAASHTHDYAPSVSATLLGSDSTAVYGRQGLQVSNFAGVGGTGANGTQLQNPTNDWYHHITLNHPNSGGYYVDIAASFHSNILAFRRVSGGTDAGWNHIYHSGNNNIGTGATNYAAGNHSHSYLPLSGGTLSGSLVTDGRVTATGSGNDYASGAFEARGNGPANTVFPTVGFHQPGLYAASLQLRGPIDFRFVAQGGASYANVTASTFYGALEGNAATATLASMTTVNASASAAYYNVVWHSGNTLFNSSAPVQIRPSDGTVAAGHFVGNQNVAGTGAASHHPSGIFSQGTNWLYGGIITAGNSIDAGGGTITCGRLAANGGLQQNGQVILNGTDTWLRTHGNTGWYSETYGGGIMMQDSTWLRVYGGKQFYVQSNSNDAIRTEGGIVSGKGYQRDNLGASWISQKDSVDVGLYSDTTSTAAYSAMIRQRHATKTWTIGGLGDSSFGIFSYYNSRTENDVDGSFSMDVVGNCAASGTMTAKSWGTGNVGAKVMTWDDFLPANPPAGLEGVITANWIAAGVINARHLQVESVVNDGGVYTSFKLQPEAVVPLRLSTVTSTGALVEDIFSVDRAGNGFFKGILSKDTVDINSIQEEARRQINPYYLGTTTGNKQENTTSTSMASGASFALPAISTVGSACNVSFKFSQGSFATSSSMPPLPATPQWRVDVYRGSTSGAVVFSKVYTGDVFRSRDGEVNIWTVQSSISIEGSFSDSSAAASQVYVVKITKIAGDFTALYRRYFGGESPNFLTNTLADVNNGFGFNNGYWKDKETGFIIQWGSLTMSANQSTTVTLPIAFPNAIVIALADNMENYSASSPTHVYSKSKTSISLINSPDSTTIVQWMAYGY